MKKLVLLLAILVGPVELYPSEMVINGGLIGSGLATFYTLNLAANNYLLAKEETRQLMIESLGMYKALMDTLSRSDLMQPSKKADFGKFFKLIQFYLKFDVNKKQLKNEFARKIGLMRRSLAYEEPIPTALSIQLPDNYESLKFQRLEELYKKYFCLHYMETWKWDEDSYREQCHNRVLDIMNHSKKLNDMQKKINSYYEESKYYATNALKSSASVAVF